MVCSTSRWRGQSIHGYIRSVAAIHGFSSTEEGASRRFDPHPKRVGARRPSRSLDKALHVRGVPSPPPSCAGGLFPGYPTGRPSHFRCFLNSLCRRRRFRPCGGESSPRRPEDPQAQARPQERKPQKGSRHQNGRYEVLGPTGPKDRIIPSIPRDFHSYRGLWLSDMSRVLATQ